MLVASKSISTAALYTPRPRFWHAYVWPFLPVYPAWLYIYLFRYEEYLGSQEYTFVSVIALLSVHALTFLICQWSINIYALLTCQKEYDPFQAKLIKITPIKSRGSSALCDLITSEDKQLSFFFQKKKYIFSKERQCFERLQYPCENQPPLGVFQSSKGLESEEMVNAGLIKYGHNRFDIPLPTFQELFAEHLVAPFFVFQLFCVALWCLDDYWYYSLFTLVMLLVFESTVVFQRLKTLKEFRSLSMQPFKIHARRNGRWIEVQSDELIPGDLCSIVRSTEETAVPCDMILVDGSCIVNEAMLSGESTPLLKESISLRNPEDVLDMELTDKNHMLFGGTKILQVTPPSNLELSAPDNGCVAYVLRTGFGSAQGKLVRTMIFSTERVSANNMEAFMFILFLLIFAIAASAYVWIEGTKNELRKRSKLVLDCILIITSVVPPELPMELSLAVNSSLVALSRYAIFCTEPFRIPFAGKVDVCCFDKTGTLTGENLVVEGIAGLGKEPKNLLNPKAVPVDSILTLACAHALVLLEDGIVGDPMEKVSLDAIGWGLEHGDRVIPIGQKGTSLHILRRFQFSSALKRMSTISKASSPGGNSRQYFVAVKGAPEILQKMYKRVPQDYEDIYKYYSRRGSRVLALGCKRLTTHQLKEDQIAHVERDFIESELEFAGFLIFHCPLKPDSKRAVAMLNNSSHRVVMITGDNPLTACHVASELDIVEKDVLILDSPESGILKWHSIDDQVEIMLDAENPKFDVELVKKYDMCLTGTALQYLEGKEEISKFLRYVWVYARVSPGQKELILNGLKQAGYVTLMCGDGTNDVGALKQADIGVALLDGTPEDLEKIAAKARLERAKQIYEQQKKMAEKFNMPPPPPPAALTQAIQHATNTIENPTNRPRPVAGRNPQEQVANLSEKLLQELDDEVPVLKFGDASVAAPFTSKLSSVMSICNIIRQGRCTLVATIQMYKILALNCLISAYSLSVMYLDGVKFGDYQATISGVLMSICFLCISRAKPLEELSKERPQANIFNFYILLSVLGQFAVHIVSLVYITYLSKTYEEQKPVNLDGDFEPNLLNSGVYLIYISMQVSTFAINYQGYPFRESLKDNKMMYYGLVTVGGIAVVAATEFVDELNSWLQLVPFPVPFKLRMIVTLFLDFGLSYVIEIVTKHFFANNLPKDIVKRD
ncbi:putative cation-transporting ATPase 1 [Basidiobolus ranarum]|uniref:Cation-transporting ATPase 1 n=1 Tax=Basidiobolus ranarum TaxID=34480 RepID=A0ABR2W3L2_9FUNG